MNAEEILENARRVELARKILNERGLPYILSLSEEEVKQLIHPEKMDPAVFVAICITLGTPRKLNELH